MRPDLRVIDGAGELKDDLTAILSSEAALVEALVQSKRREAALKGELTKLRQVDDRAEEIEAVLEYWRKECNHPRAEIPPAGKRWTIVQARMADGFDVARLKRAIDGAVAFPYEAQYGERFSMPGQGRKRRDDLALHILRDEVQTERRIALAEGDGPYRAYKRFVFDAIRKDPVLVDHLAGLGVVEPHGEVLARAVVWARGEVEKRKGGA